ncbi:MAG: hypothetical protein FJY85_02190, partial [Deltaproteobacteria bacterium]|nr:hypothetical protein [Deltaproteobacteria bacterium]
PCRVADTVERIAQRSGRRTVELWELRRELAEIPRKALDEALQALGRSRVLELKPVQDATRLTTLQREGILTLNDGVQVLSVALFAQTR